MLDFMKVELRNTRSGVEVAPKFIIKKSQDLMIRGGDFYGIWLEDQSRWSTDEQDAVDAIDRELKSYVSSHQELVGYSPKVLYMWDSDSGSIDRWHRYVQKQLRDSFHPLDEQLIFSNTPTAKENYASRSLNYALVEAPCPSYDKLIGTLYTEEERHKIEYAIGSIINGDSKKLQKFMVLYGSAGAGKSTILNIIQMLFDGYVSVFSAKALGSANNAFALEAFTSNPLVAIEHDGDLSRIEDNTRINSLVSHEPMTVNEKFKRAYTNAFNAFLFIGTNKPVKITDAKSGLLRRLIDVSPSGKKVPLAEYNQIMASIPFELSGIAWHCKMVYEEDPNYYDDYTPVRMLGASNDFYNFMESVYILFSGEKEGVSLKRAWDLYKNYVEDAKVAYPMSQRVFKEELRNYFKEYHERYQLETGERVRSFYSGFRTDIFEPKSQTSKTEEHYDESQSGWIHLKHQHSLLDDIYSGQSAQYSNEDGTPSVKWANNHIVLSQIDTSREHYVIPMHKHIVVDFDLKDSKGEKSLLLNLEAASMWPPTYVECSKSGEGLHLHYIYEGDPSELSALYSDGIEIKTFNGNASLRRRLTLCNDISIATIGSGLPRKEKKMVSVDIENERHLRALISKHLRKEIMGHTAPSVNMIKKILDEAYESGLVYDISDMKDAIIAFASGSHHQADNCLKACLQMKWHSEDEAGTVIEDELPIAIYDLEVYQNLFVCCWKKLGSDYIEKWINPDGEQIENFIKTHRIVGFNNRGYDNHILYGRMLGYSNIELYNLSQSIIENRKGALFGPAYNLSYTDIYDFCVKKQSLKKWEIELGIHHQEMGIPWDQPVPDDMVEKVVEYCCNDVMATEAVWNKRQADLAARKLQVAIAQNLHPGIRASVNDTTNTLSRKIIFGGNANPQSAFNYRNLAEPVGSDRYSEYVEKFGPDYKFRVWDADGLPVYRDYIPGEELPDGWSILPFFPGYEFKGGVSTYLGDVIGEGGKVYGNPGFYSNVWDGDVSSQHPHSAIMEVLFGPVYTKIFEDIVKARVAVKHHDFEAASSMLNGALVPFLSEDNANDLAQALKIVINSIYGLTSAGFMNAFRDARNIDNIVAKRGALFMTLLKREVEKQGYRVAHIKTDSIKIPDADEKIKEFVIKFGKEYGYSFETEADFEKFALVNNAVYVAKTEKGWTATGAQFAVPYVFKTLFSHENITFEDMCETYSVVAGALYLDMNEELPDVTEFEQIKEWRTKLESTGKLSKQRKDILERFSGVSPEELDARISEGHDYKFVGRVGLFTPVVAGAGGGILYRRNEGKNFAASGSTGYRWLESETVKLCHLEDKIDRSFYERLVTEAKETLSAFGDLDWLLSDKPVEKNDIFPLDEPPWLMQCGKESCIGCKHFNSDFYHLECDKGYDISDLEAMNSLPPDGELPF